MAAACTDTSGEQLEWAHRRSRLGLKLGPMALLGYLGLSLLLDWWEIGQHPLGQLVLALVMLAHVASFVECVATMPAWRYRPVPRPVVLLSVYWIALVGWLAVGFVQGAA